MKTCLLIFTDGRAEYFVQTIDAFMEFCDWKFDTIQIMDDSGDPDYREFLAGTVKLPCKNLSYIFNTVRMGFCGSYKRAWELISRDIDYIFNLEDDFVFQRNVPVKEAIDFLKANENLAQVSFMRQPVNHIEKAAGSLWSANPEAWIQRDGFVEHKLCFTTNPSIYPAWVAMMGWPDGPNCEQTFSEVIFDDPEMRSAYYGTIGDKPFCEHIGTIQKGYGY